MKKNKTEEEVEALRDQFDKNIKSGNLALTDAIRAMRNITSMTQSEFSSFLKIAERTLKDVESQRGNPTLETLNKIALPFGLEVGFIKKPKP